MRYEFQSDGVQHGYLSVFDDNGNLLATVERWWEVKEEEIARMENHECRPGQMIPHGDPRWYTHCQWCGNAVAGEKTAYYSGQYHWRCYDKHFDTIKRG